ncbi:MAG: MFS transporter [Planctomycetota bacterium]
MNNPTDDENAPAPKQPARNVQDSVTETKKKSLRYSIIEGCAASLMTGFGDGYILPFAVFLRASDLFIGFLAAIPPAVGTVAQLISVDILDQHRKRKSLIIPGVVIQMIMWLPIFLLPLIFRDIGPVLLIIGMAIYTAAGQFTVPAWNSLMGDLTEPDKRGKYFAQRNRLASIFSFGSSLLAGLVILHYLQPVNEWLGYGIIFGLAFISRGVSAYYLNKMSEPEYVVKKEDYFSLWDFLRRSPKSNFARFVFYIALISMAVAISGPFFTVYMFRDLKFSYAEFTIINAINVIAQFLVMRYWGRLCDRYGNRRILCFTGWLISFIPILWLLSPDFYAVVIYQICAGVVWSGFNLAVGNFIFDAVSPAKRARCVAYFSLLTNTGVSLGSILGGWLTLYMPDSLFIFGWHITLVSSLQVLFLISGLLRLLISALFLTHIKEVRQVEHITTWELIFNFSMIKPVLGPIFDIFTGGKEDKES